MHLVPLHNVLLSAARVLHADAVALRLLPSQTVRWQPLDVAVGDTALLRGLGWREGEQNPQPPGVPVSKSLFDLSDSLELFVNPQAAALKIEVCEELLNALPSQFKSFEKRNNARDVLGTFWLALAFDNPADLNALLDYEDGSASLTELVIGVATQTLWSLYQSQQAHADPVTNLPGTEEFRARLRRLVQQTSTDQVGLFIIGIDDYPQRRRLLGQEHAESLLNMTARMLEREVRKDDALYCYREAQFAVLTHTPNAEGAQLFADKLHRSLSKLRLDPSFSGTTASVGYLTGEDADTQQLDAHGFSLCAEQALDHARLSGGDSVVRFSGAFAEDESTQRHLVSSLLTDPERGYRNNYILWQTMALLAGQPQPTALAESFVALLKERLEVPVVMLVDAIDGELVRLDAPEFSLLQAFNDVQVRLVRRVLDTHNPMAQVDAIGDRQCLLIPLVTRDLKQGCLYIESNVSFDMADRVFLSALADQMAAGLDRANLIRIQLSDQLKSSEAQQDPVVDDQLRVSSTSSRVSSTSRVSSPSSSSPPKPITLSVGMQAVMSMVERIAPTDVSVLVMGESGVGKEVMARAIHAASKRSAEPLVVVDCSAITPTLIESELFGRVKGAYTGADAASAGRIAQAHGGTLFLDEIGELPLDVQAKLLRFVQEKEVVAVGGTDTRIIDTRIVCATNRDLQAEVSAGRFRADLYFRLQAIQLQVPPLRERGEDLSALVDVFLSRFNDQFEKNIDSLSEQAWRKVLTHTWPGNVRELQNTIMRAVVIAHGNTIEVEDIQLGSLLGTPDPAPSFHTSEGESAHAPELCPPTFQLDDEPPESQLASFLRHQLDTACAAEEWVPIGRWLSDALILRAWERHQQVVVAAARTLGMPETTLRRQLIKAKNSQRNPLFLHSRAWTAGLPMLFRVLDDIMAMPESPAKLIDYIDAILMQEITQLVGDDAEAGAALLGVTPPTYLRRVNRLQTQLLAPAGVSL